MKTEVSNRPTRILVIESMQINSANSVEFRTVEGDSPSNGESKRDRYLESWYEEQ